MRGETAPTCLELVNCSLTNNEASSGPGGAVTAFLLSLLVRGCQLTRNIARQLRGLKAKHRLGLRYGIRNQGFAAHSVRKQQVLQTIERKTELCPWA